jgi:hypothetical protein
MEAVFLSCTEVFFSLLGSGVTALWCCLRVRGTAIQGSNGQTGKRYRSITSSASAIIAGGTSSPSALAVRVLMISLKVVARCVGRSFGRLPSRIGEPRHLTKDDRAIQKRKPAPG